MRWQALILVALSSSLHATTDLNIHQLQYVADHLTDKECRKLAEALREKTFKIQNVLTGNKEPNRICIALLLHWDRNEGKGKTFSDLSLRLRQIGRSDVANTLSKSVFHEKALAIKQGYLNDPFKEMIPTKSSLLDEEDVDSMIESKPEDDSQFTAWEIACAFSGALCTLVLVLLLFRTCCPTFVPLMWRKYAPDMWVDMCSLFSKECSSCCFSCKENYYVHVIGEQNGVSRDLENQV